MEGVPMILDTSFLIDLERELRRQANGPACKFLETAPKISPLYLTETIIGELAAGESLADREIWECFIAPYTILFHDRETAWHYGRAFRALRRTGKLIGSNDLWIAAAGLARNLPVVTRNIDEFRRVDGLRVIGY